MKKFLYTLVLSILFLCVLPNNSYASTITIKGTPLKANLAGEDVGDIGSFIITYDLSIIPEGSNITRATCITNLIQKEPPILTSFKLRDLNNTDVYQMYNTQKITTTFDFDCIKMAKGYMENKTEIPRLEFSATSLKPTDVLEFNNFHMLVDFQEPDTTKPELVENVQVQKLSAGKYTISAKTNEPVTAILEYGKTSNYGSMMNISSLSTDIRFIIEDTQSGITYHYRLKFIDIAGNQLITPNSTFTTTLETPTPTIEDAANETQDSIEVSSIIATLESDKYPYSVKVEWEHDSLDEVIGYKILRRDIDYSTYEEIERVGKSEREFIDKHVKNGKIYQYKIKTLTDVIESNGVESNEVSVKEGASTSTEKGDNTLLTIIGITIAIVFTIVLYLAIKSIKKIKVEKEQEAKKKNLENTLRDPKSAFDMPLPPVDAPKEENSIDDAVISEIVSEVKEESPTE